MGFLDSLPLNGFKTIVGYVGSLLVLGAWAADMLSADAALQILTVVQLWTGVAIGHKVSKDNRGV